MAGSTPLPAPIPDVVRFFRVLADQTRLAIVRLLARSDLRAGEIVELMQLPQNAISYHLKQLRAVGLLRDRRSSADARDIYYSLDLERLQALYHRAGEVLQVLPAAPGHDGANVPDVAHPLRILYLCTHNSARSQFAEALTRQAGGQRVMACSAGDTPTAIHPMTSTLLTEWQIDPAGQESKSLDHFAGQSFDYVITVCDRVREHCPTFPASATQVHWSIPDPTTVEGEEDRWAAFRAVRHEVDVRVRHLLRQHLATMAVAA
jgi:ArsR family transcriptional regulator, arsenate/arsenite/antimonite-responsive transcriptional repressor / arsenate reductase (thioredoxin)